MSYKLPELPYSYNALEPHIDAKTMEIHHTKHHGTYVTNLNKAIADAHYQAPECCCELIANLKAVPESIRTVVRNNGGGHVNHSFFWKLITPSDERKPLGHLSKAIDHTFQSFDGFKEVFTKAALGRFGSGWAWLCLRKSDNSLFICSTPNQDNPIMEGSVEQVGEPIIGIDVWEHAYYLHYQNRRADYINAFWNVLNWSQAEENYQEVIG
jgi:Fe-Mn family superoxide dismutase